MTKGKASSADQQGVALIVALIILLLVSVLGLSAMRSSIFSAKIAAGVQADAMTFEAAESGLSASFSSLSALNDLDLYSTIEGRGTTYCLGSDGLLDTGSCGGNNFGDSRQLVRAEIYNYLAGLQPIDGSQVSISGAAGIFADYRINMLSLGEMPSYNLESNHLQESLKRGIKPDGDIE